MLPCPRMIGEYSALRVKQGEVASNWNSGGGAGGYHCCSSSSSCVSVTSSGSGCGAGASSTSSEGSGAGTSSGSGGAGGGTIGEQTQICVLQSCRQPFSAMVWRVKPDFWATHLLDESSSTALTQILPRASQYALHVPWVSASTAQFPGPAQACMSSEQSIPSRSEQSN